MSFASRFALAAAVAFAPSLLVGSVVRAAEPPPLPPPPPPPPQPTSTQVTAPPPPSDSARPRKVREKEKESEEKREKREEPVEMGEDEAPAASKGFQVGVRAGLGVPFAKATENAKMSDTFSPQFRVGADIGVKLTSEWFLGGYVGLGLGGTAGGTSQACDAANVSCGVATFQLGVEGQYHFLPNQKINPWIGYGIGWEFSDLSRGSSASSTFSGPDFMHLMGGADFRISRTVAMGPFLDTSLGVYNHASTQNGGTTVSTSLQGEKTVHGWVSLGVHVVFFP